MKGYEDTLTAIQSLKTLVRVNDDEQQKKNSYDIKYRKCNDKQSIVPLTLFPPLQDLGAKFLSGKKIISTPKRWASLGEASKLK